MTTQQTPWTTEPLTTYRGTYGGHVTLCRACHSTGAYPVTDAVDPYLGTPECAGCGAAYDADAHRRQSLGR